MAEIDLGKVVGPAGPKGETGDQGAPGQIGPVGPTGPKGEDAYDIGTTAGTVAEGNDERINNGQIAFEEMGAIADSKVDKITGKGLSENDYTTPEKNKLAAIAAGADVSVNPDWNATSGKAAINNKPNLALKADLVAGKIPESQLPSYVDDVLEFANLAAFPSTGEAGKIYTALDTNFIYRWSGSAYIRINEGVVIGETSTTAGRGDHAKAAYDMRHEHENKAILDSIDASKIAEWDGKAVIGAGASQVRNNQQLDARYLQSQRYKAVTAVAANRTIAVADEDCLWIVTGTRTLTVPTNATVAFPIGGRIDLQVSAGAIANIEGASGVTLTHKDGTGNTTREGFIVFTLIKTAANAWTVVGG